MKKFLLLFALIISGMGLFAQDAAVEITVYEQTATKLTLKFTPNEYTKQYYCGVFEKEGVGFSLDKAGELYYSEPCVGENIYQFEIQYPVDYNTCAVAIGYDENPDDVFFGDLFGALTYKPVEAPNVAIDFKDVTATTLTYSAKFISSYIDDFSFNIYTVAEFEESFKYSSNEEIGWDIDYNGELIYANASGSYTCDNLNPNTEYVAAATVYYGGSCIASYFRFGTKKDAPAGISIEVTDVTATTADVSYTLNSNTEKFHATVIGKTDFDNYSEEEWIDYIIEETEPLSKGGKYTWSGLNPGTKYVIAAVAVNEYGDPSELVSASFTTEEGIPEDGWWTVDYNGYSLDYVAFSSTECAVRGNKAPEEPTTINIPSEVSKDGKNYKVVQIYDNAFELWKNAISFNLPTSIKKIGEYAFSECTSMDNLPIPESVETIGANAFEKCSRLVTVNMSKTVKEIGVKAFFECKDLGTVTFAENSVINKIADNAFLDCSSLYKITIPGSVSELGEGVFKNCTGLKDVTFGDNSKLVKLKDSTFENCEKLKNVTFGKNSSLTSINENLFSDSPNLESIVFGDNAKLGIVEENAFKDHAKLSKVAFGKNSVLHTIYDYSFQGCTSLTLIEIPSSVSLLGRSAFEGCSKLPSFVVPEGVTSIGNSTFKDCTSLKSFEISSTVTTIPNYAFSGCTSLAKIICRATTVPETGDEIFEGVPSNMTIYVPGASLSSYQSAEPWKNYILKSLATLDVTEINANGFNIYPNPVESNLTIDTDEVITEINIYSLTGVIVYQTTAVNNNVINVSDLNDGVYFINIKTENGDVVKRFVKN